MKIRLSKKPSKEENKVFQQVKKYLKTDEELFTFMATYMGMLSIMLDFLSETYGTPTRMKELPDRTKYAMAQAIHHYHLLGKMVRGELDTEELGIRYVPIEGDAWTNPEKISDKMVVVVKVLYDQLKEEGLISKAKI
jgi:hypothetical protein